MRVLREVYALEASIGEHLPELRRSQRQGLALWVLGTVLAQSSCQSAVVSALVGLGGHSDALRQRLREWLYDGDDRAAPCQVQLDVAACMAPLLRWVLSWWQGLELALAIDATLHGDKLAALVISVLYRGCAIPVAWHILPANQPGQWMEPILDLIERLAPAVPNTMTVLILADRGLYSPRLWDAIVAQGWHPLLRVQRHYTFQPTTVPGVGPTLGPARERLGLGKVAWPNASLVGDRSRSSLCGSPVKPNPGFWSPTCRRRRLG